MSNYFHDMIPAGELARLQYIPTVPEFLQWIEEQYPESPAISNIEKTYTYKQFCDNIGRRRALLNSLGLEKGSHVAILDRNTIDAVELFLAITSAGYVSMFLPASLPAPAVAGCCRKFSISALFVAESLKESASAVEGVKVLDSKSTGESIDPVTPVDKDAPAAIFFTGGSTGAPKGAVLPHRALMRGSLNGCFSPGSVIGGHRYIGFLPLSHVFGAIRGLLSVFYTGNLWYECPDIKAMMPKVQIIKPTTLVLVPGLCEVLAGLVKMYGIQFLGGALKTIIAGAANVPPRLISVFDNLGIQLLAGYGLTEGANLSTGNADVKTHPTSIGKFYPGQEYKLVDGELWIKGDNVFLGYYNDPETTKAALTEDGWLRTGDLARIDEEGFAYITGRIKNLIILSNGENVSPESIEEPFYADDFVRDAIAKEDFVDDRQVIAIEILPNLQAFGGAPFEEIEKYMNDLVGKINATLPTTHRISKVTVRTEDFKRTGSLKVSRI